MRGSEDNYINIENVPSLSLWFQNLYNGTSLICQLIISNKQKKIFWWKVSWKHGPPLTVTIHILHITLNFCNSRIHKWEHSNCQWRKTEYSFFTKTDYYPDTKFWLSFWYFHVSGHKLSYFGMSQWIHLSLSTLCNIYTANSCHCVFL